MKINYEATYRQVSVPANAQQYNVVRMEISLAFIAPGDTLQKHQEIDCKRDPSNKCKITKWSCAKKFK